MDVYRDAELTITTSSANQIFLLEVPAVASSLRCGTVMRWHNLGNATDSLSLILALS
jgi:hypothetical protein